MNDKNLYRSSDSLENIHTLSTANPGPGSYFSNLGKTFIGDFKKLGKMGHEGRFTDKNPLYKKDLSPGPGTYALQSHKSVYESACKHQNRGSSLGKMGPTSFDSQGQFYSTFGNTYDKYNNVYHKENAKAFENREGPGPGSYNNQDAFRQTIRSLKYSFPK